MVSVQELSFSNTSISSDFDLTVEGTLTDRTVGTHCSIDVKFYDSSTEQLFYSFSPCYDISASSNWLEFSYMNRATPLRIIQNNGPFELKLAPSAQILITDTVELSMPPEILKANVQLINIKSVQQVSAQLTIKDEAVLVVSGVTISPQQQLIIRFLSFNGTQELGKTERGAILKAFDQYQAEMFSTLLPRIEFEAYPIDLKVTSNASQQLNVFKGQEPVSLTLEMSFPVTPAASYTRLVIVIPSPLNFTLLLKDKSDFSVSSVLKVTQLQNYTGRLEAPPEPSSVEASGAQGSFSSANNGGSVQMVSAEVTVLQGPLLAKGSVSLKLENFQVPLASLAGNWLRVEMYEPSRDMPGFVGNTKPLLSLMPRSIELTGANAEFELRKSSFIQEVGVMRFQTTYKTDGSCPDVLQLTVRLEGVLDLIGNNSCALQSGTMLSVCKLERIYSQGGSVLVKAQLFTPALQALTAPNLKNTSEVEASLPEMEFSFKLIIGLVNSVKPESSLVTWYLSNEAGDSILNTSKRVSFGCKANCAACFIEGTDRCLGCKRGYRLNGKECEEIALIITLGQLILASPHLSRDTIGLMAVFGLLVSGLIHTFLRKLYNRLILLRVIEKLLLGNLNTIVIYLHLIGQDSPTWVEAFLGPWLLAMSLLYALLFGMYLFLVKDYPFVSIKSGHWSGLLWKWFLISFMGITNLYSLTIDSAVVKVLVKQERDLSGSKKATSGKGTAVSSNSHTRAHTVAQFDGIELRQRGDILEPYPRSAVVSEAPSKPASVKSGNSTTTSKMSFKTIAELQGKMLVLNLFDLVRWLNVSVKSLFVLIVIAIEALCSPSVWRTLPFEILVLVALEIMHYVFFSIEHKEVHPPIEGSPEVIKLLGRVSMKQRASAAQVAIAKPTEVLNFPNDCEAVPERRDYISQNVMQPEHNLQFVSRHPETIAVGFSERWDEDPVDHLEKLYESIWEKNSPEAQARRARIAMREEGSSLDIDSFEDLADDNFRKFIRSMSPKRGGNPKFADGDGMDLLDKVIALGIEELGLDADFPLRKDAENDESIEMSDASVDEDEPAVISNPHQKVINSVNIKSPRTPPSLVTDPIMNGHHLEKPSDNSVQKRKSRTTDNTPLKELPKMSAFMEGTLLNNVSPRQAIKMPGFEPAQVGPAKLAVGPTLVELAQAPSAAVKLSDLY